MPSILTSLSVEHDASFRIIDRWRHDEEEADAVFRLLGEVIRVHFRDEETILFPALEAAFAGDSEAAGTRKLRAEHQALAERFEALVKWREEDGQTSELDRALDTLCTDLINHSDEEEARVFALATEQLDIHQLARLQSKRFECSCCGG